MMKKLLHILIFSCKQATFRIEQQLQHKISWPASIRLAIHVSLCDACRIYQLQSKQIDKKLSENLTENEIEVLENEPLKERILAILHDANDVS